ncbi:E3 ubiquitin-protein ligase TRIM39-like [Neosynchiropus ocellatus]
MADLREVTDQFKCPVCLKLFEQPVAIPCGHNFCQVCISFHWNANKTCDCPVCKEVFTSRPELRVNQLIFAMVKAFQVRRTGSENYCNVESSDVNVAKSRVNCDECDDQQAVKTCLVCTRSYCNTHLQPHVTIPGLRMHKLVEPRGNMSARKCSKHKKLLELFCRTDQISVCSKCFVEDHQFHETVPMRIEYEGKKAEAAMVCQKFQEMIASRQQKMNQLKVTQKLNDERAKCEKDEGMAVLTALKTLVSDSTTTLIDTIEAKRNTTDKQVRGFIDELQKELSDLKGRKSELEYLNTTNDPALLLRRFYILNADKPSKDWSQVSVSTPTYSGTAAKMIASLEEKIGLETKQIQGSQLKRLQQASANITLDPETANPWLIVSNDRKTVRCGPTFQHVSDNPRRFTFYASVLACESLTSGQLYFEANVSGKTKWDIGMASESIDRNRPVGLNPDNGYWVVSMRKGKEYRAAADPPKRLSLPSRVQKLGIYVNYDNKLVSFYDADTATLIHTFSGCSFSGRIYPFFNPCNTDYSNSAPITITSPTL